MSQTLLCFFSLLAQERGASIADLRVGHVIEVRGAFDEHGRFVVQKAELMPADEDDVLIGTVPAKDTDPESFTLLGQRVDADERTTWEGIEQASLAGKRIKVAGTYKGPTRFRAKSIAPRGEGRDRIGA